MSAMVNLEVPWINIMSKMDLVTANVEDPGSARNGIRTKKDISRYVCCLRISGISDIQDRYLEPDPMLLISAPGSRQEKTERNSRFHALNHAIVQLVRKGWLCIYMI